MKFQYFPNLDHLNTHFISKISLKNFFQHFFQRNGPGPLNITFGSDMPITLLHLMLMSKIYVVNSDMKNVIGISDPNVMFKRPGPINRKGMLHTVST